MVEEIDGVRACRERQLVSIGQLNQSRRTVGGNEDHPSIPNPHGGPSARSSRERDLIHSTTRGSGLRHSGWIVETRPRRIAVQPGICRGSAEFRKLAPTFPNEWKRGLRFDRAERIVVQETVVGEVPSLGLLQLGAVPSGPSSSRNPYLWSSRVQKIIVLHVRLGGVVPHKSVFVLRTRVVEPTCGVLVRIVVDPVSNRRTRQVWDKAAGEEVVRIPGIHNERRRRLLGVADGLGLFGGLLRLAEDREQNRSKDSNDRDDYKELNQRKCLLKILAAFVAAQQIIA